jgi:hypothetical protein
MEVLQRHTLSVSHDGEHGRRYVEIVNDNTDRRERYANIVTDNNNGITVVDITNPVDLAYCFVSIGGDMEAEGYAEVPNHVPLTATQYLRAYYPESLDPLASKFSRCHCISGFLLSRLKVNQSRRLRRWIKRP